MVLQVAVKLSGQDVIDRPFKSFATIMGGESQVLWYGFLRSPESIKELSPHVQRLAARLSNKNVVVRAVYTDKCCQYRPELNKVSLPLWRSFLFSLQHSDSDMQHGMLYRHSRLVVNTLRLSSSTHSTGTSAGSL